jgi:hypothetical protein
MIHILTLAAAGKISQIKAYRTVTGSTLTEAKAAVEAVRGSEDKEISLACDLAYVGVMQRKMVVAGMAALGHAVTLVPMMSAIQDVGYYTVYWSPSTSWEIEVFSFNDEFMFREGRRQRYLHPLGELQRRGSQADYKPSFFTSTEKRFTAANE